MNASGTDSLHKVYLGIGSNISPEANLQRAIGLLARTADIDAISSVWESPPVGGEGENYLNAVLLIRTPLSQEGLRSEVLRPIEALLGRVRTGNPNAPRPIDLDILLFDDIAVENSMWEVAHVAVPLAELYPDYTHPENGLALGVAATLLQNTSPIKLRPDIGIQAKFQEMIGLKAEKR